MRPASFACCVLALLAACGREPGSPAGPGNVDQGGPAGKDTTTLTTIAGTYPLASVDGLPLPCCGTRDSTGDVVTIVGGTLTLEAAPSEVFVPVPSGYMMSKSCIHQIPNGALVDTGNVVRMPDGSSYRLPPCGDAAYRLTVLQRHQRDGSTTLATDSGLYVWGHGYITLVGRGSAPSRFGEVTSVEQVHISVQHYERIPPVATGHVYDFAATKR